jgi:DNA repair photolyase
MRWDNLTVETDREARLPAFKEPAVVRTFDAPEALGTRFYEVRARSAINEVPKRSRMPFRFTINPYRGCSHACVYCSSGETPILMADGRTKPLSDVRVGEAIYGTIWQGRYRRYVVTRVQDHWSTCKRAYRITLEDGTELIASGDHRFLTNRGWKHVTGAEYGRARRPHLTLNNKLMGLGHFVATPDASEDYRRGYLCGMIRGDGHLARYEYSRPGRSNGNVSNFRLALADDDALWRTRDYLAEAGVLTGAFLFQPATDRTRKVIGIRTSRGDDISRIQRLIGWARSPSDCWRRGFLAGVFDAEGTRGGHALRIANKDPEIVARTVSCLRHLGHQSVVERRPNGVMNVRLTGGLAEQLRFLHGVDPAITRKRGIAGIAVKSNARLGVAEIEPLGEMELFDITTGTGDFIADGVISHNCFARPTHTYLDFNAREDFEREIVVKVNVPELVRAELGRQSWKGDHVALGTNTDPYQWVEGRYKLMPGVWEAMRDFANPCSVLTKSPLLLRDMELMKELTEVTDFAANLSIPTLDEKAWRETEPHTPHPRKRIEAVADLNRAGIATGVLIAPLIPGVNDSPQQVEEILELVGEAGARTVGAVGLHLRGEVREIWFDWLRQYRPDLIPRFEELYARGAYLPRGESERLSRMAKRGRDVGGTRGVRKRPAERGEGVSPSPERQPRLF